MRNLVAIISKRKGDKNGHGQDTILTIYDLNTTYADLIKSALAQMDDIEIDIEGVTFEDIAAARDQQRASWEKVVADEDSVANQTSHWANRTEYKGVPAIQHRKTGQYYIQGYALFSKTLEFDENRPAEKKQRGHRNGVTAAKAAYRKLTGAWRMSAVTDGAMVFTGEEAAMMYAAAK